ncbi:hypothetical protein PF438_03940 [Elizabethkingia meningoseptica]|uniref:hypothetical protein n=1 Tax=Elizabethkingia meningoseptica TaxID=238 RepID=UPI0022F15BC3|nr:hypothetical protein [Elizabethkingia meningoseptica]EJK5329797.1 hypothetical protein [Elizabethkingia meningoseptica]WBS75642.1 hypothetical protein PF438_03940 [Elizabethkingia meningoseptica]
MENILKKPVYHFFDYSMEQTETNIEVDKTDLLIDELIIIHRKSIKKLKRMKGI